MSFQVAPFTFTADSSGSPDAITLPGSIPAGCREVIVTPPAGHAWNVFGIQSGTGKAMGVDEAYVFKRSDARGAFLGGETIGYASLDTGTGTFTGICQ